MSMLVIQPLDLAQRTMMRRLVALFFSALILGMVANIDYIFQGRSLLEKGPPDWSAFGWVKTVGAMAAAWLFLIALSPNRPNATRLIGRDAVILRMAFALTSGVLSLVTIVVIAFPETLDRTVREGQLLGVLTEVALVAAFAWLTSAAVRSRGSKVARPLGIPISAIYGLMIAVTFIILMEEISWGQHWVGWSSGPLFEGNAQNETNLHNFATYKFEACFYTAAMLLFVALPEFWPGSSAPLSQSIGRFVPTRSFVLVGLPLAGLWFEEWNILPYQFLFFLGVMIAVRISSDRRHADQGLRVAAGGMALLLVGSQVVFLSFGHRMVDGYELSEVREFLISCSIAVYAWLAIRRETS